MAGIGGVVKDVVSEVAETGAKGAVEAGAKGAGAVTKAQKGLYQRALDRASTKILDGTDNIIDRAVNKNLGETVGVLKAREARLAKAAENGVIGKAAAKAGTADAVKDIVQEGENKIARGTKRNALIGSAIGGISGAGVGGIAGMATGADKDNQNGMIVTGALAGMAGGAMVGGLFGNNISKVAGGIAKGASNEAVEGGAKGLLKNAGASTQNFADKIDDIGENISKKFNKDFIDQNSSIRKEMAYQIKKNQGGTAQEALEKARNITDAMSSGSYEPENVMEQMVGNIYNDNVAKMRRGNAIGKAAQEAIIGSAGGALVGGVAGGIDEDDTFIGGALKGGLIGGAVGGIGGGVSGYFNNNAKLFANTTANVNSLLEK